MNIRSPLTVAHHQRKPGPRSFSIERLFSSIRSCIHGDVRLKVFECPFLSKGIWRRLRNVYSARQVEADVHHIVGDVHYLAFALPRRRLVLTVHDCAALNRSRGWKRAALKYGWYVGPMRRAAIVTTISETAKRELVSAIGPLAAKVRVVPNCVCADFYPIPKPHLSCPPVVLQVGTGWNKNLERVASAVAGTGAMLAIVGTMSAQQRAHVRSCRIQYFEFGRLSDAELVTAYERCDLVVFASLYEGFGLPILEAQAVGRPVVTSNRSSMPEVAGNGAILVNPESVEDIHNAIQQLISDDSLRARLVDAGFENVSKYKPAEVARRYQQIYSELHR